ncbi:unnamed protein product [Soboliphyme baturini]|uniref:DZF domain-containing protein n=1 Tax=Soboliphyme baturini TaxID=241478 RepID=A0A183J8E0_9BILA|nr:unnamed protein product [Soboliphyme baturini]
MSSCDVLECSAYDCPQLVRNDFADLFPEVDVRNQPLTVLTLTQKTERDMACWSVDMEEEREKLMQTFIVIASDICDLLASQGYWAEFIDPNSGRPVSELFFKNSV